MTVLDEHGRPLNGKPDCDHAACIPAFDEDAAKGLDASEVRRRWPRFMGRCRDCGAQVIMYASWMQYIAGDY